MAKIARLAGITAGLVIGLAGGVLLAVMNPLIPNEDKTQVISAPSMGQSTNLGQDAAPAMAGGQNDVAMTGATVDQPLAAGVDAAPKSVSQDTAAVQTGTASGLKTPAMQDGDTSSLAAPASNDGALGTTGGAQPTAGAQDKAPRKLVRITTAVETGDASALAAPNMADTGVAAIALSNNSDLATASGKVQTLPKVATQSSPDVSTAPATPLQIAEPNVDGSSSVQPGMPALAGDDGVIASRAMDQGSVIANPKKVAQAPDVMAALPTVAKTKRPVNKSGTFRTGSSSLATSGSAGFASRKLPESGVQFPKFGGSDTAALSKREDTTKVNGALQRNALEFAGADKPLLSIVLLDIGDKGLPRKTLQNLTIPAAFALPADQADVAALAQSYTKAGFEVLALSPRAVEMSLSGGLDQAQVDGMITQIFAEMPQAIGLIDRTTGDLQKDRKLAKSVVRSFQKTGHGLLTYAEGLNPVPRAAAEAKVAAGTIYRVLDAKGEGAAVITRFLDRAALDARRNGHVIVLGTTAGETVATIVNWTLGPKARGVALAPVSASLLATIE